MYAPLQELVSSLVSREGEAIPLQGVSISGEIMSARAKIVIRQRYLHKGSKAIEAIYTFPIPSDAVVIAFSMECAGRRMESEVKEKQSAQKAYEEAISSGDGAALLVQTRPNVFTAFVGNILPGEETIIETVYLQRLSGTEGALRLLIPTLVAPRYTPASGANPEELRSPPIADNTQKLYGLSINLIFDLGRDISIESPSHDIVMSKLEGHKQRVTLERPEIPLDRDLVLLAFSDESEDAAGFLAHKMAGQPGTFALTIVPDFLPKLSKKPGKDVVFVVDVSGSMEGLAIEQAQSALKLCLRHLREGDCVQIIAFSSGYKTFEPQMAPFTQGTLEAADRWVNALVADGGTEMLKPMMVAVQLLKQSSKKRARIVVLMTDGQVSNEREIVSNVESNADGARVYTFGIGTSVSDFIVRELAKATGGASEFIFPGERIDTKVTAQFAKATALRLENPSIGFQGVEVFDLSPAELSPLTDGTPWTLFGRFSAAGHGRAQISGSLAGAPFSIAIPIELPENSSRPDLETLWAAGRIEDLEKQVASNREAAASRQKAIDLSMQYRIACQFTSMLVVERRSAGRKSGGDPESVVVPASPPAGWDMFDEGGQSDGYSSTSTRAGTISPKGAMLMKALSAAGPSALRARMAPPLPAAASAPYSPPPPAMAMMPMEAPSAPSSSAPPTLGASLGKAVKGVFGKIFGSDQADSQAAPPPAPPARQAPPAPPVPRAPSAPLRKPAPPASSTAAPADDQARTRKKAEAPHKEASAQALAPILTELSTSINELMEQQLASGLWELSPESLHLRNIEDARLLATARALYRCHEAGADTNDAMFGVPIRKAVEALCEAIAQRPAAQADERALKAAIAAALMMATRRLRAQVMAAAEAVNLKDFASPLSNAEAAKQKLLELKIP